MPSEFWRLTPSEFCVLLEAARPEARRGSLREQELDQLHATYELHGEHLL